MNHKKVLDVVLDDRGYTILMFLFRVTEDVL